jgi:hypothetical protein
MHPDEKKKRKNLFTSALGCFLFNKAERNEENIG